MAVGRERGELDADGMHLRRDGDRLFESACERAMELCAVLAIMATFSTASGLLCWILCAPLLFLRKNSSAEKQDEPAASTPFRLWHIVVWCCGFALTTAIYFYHYARP